MSHSLPLRIARSDPIASDPPRFVVAGQVGTASGDVKLYEWHRERGDMRLAGLQTDAGQIRAMEWSPSPTHRHLVGLGLSTGRTLLLNLSPQTLSLPLNNGTTSATPASTICVLPVKHVRATTSVAFSPVDHNYLATGYEKHRSDYSLLIWDLSTALAAVPADGDSNWQRPLDRLEVTNAVARDLTRLNPSEPRHIQHYCQGEHINDVAFLTTGYSLLASANNKAIRLYDLRAPGQGAATPKDPASAGAAGAAAQWNTRAVSGLMPDPTREGRFASYETSPGGTLSTVRLWDTRQAVGEVASFEIRSGVFGLEWISGGAGYAKLGVGTRDGVNVIDVTDGREVTDSGVQEWTTVGDIRNVVKPKHNLHSFAFSNAEDKRRSDVLFVVKDGTIGIGPVAPVPSLASGSRGGVAVAGSGLNILDPDSAEAHSEMEDPEDEASDNEDDFVRSNRFQLNPARVNDILAEASRSRTGSPNGSVFGSKPGTLRKPGREISVRMSDDVREGGDLGWDGWRRALRADMGCVMRRRAEEGYGLENMLLNAAIATRYPGHDRLAGIWEFLDHFISVMDPDSSVTRSTNLTYAGIHSIWTGQDLALTPPSPTSIRSNSTLVSEIGRPPSQASTQREPVKQGSAAWTSLRNNQLPTRSQSTPIATPSPAPPTPERIVTKALPDADFAAAVDHINARRDTDEHPGRIGRTRLPATDKVAQRRMILAVCGEREAGEVNKLVEDDMRTKAASWAYFSGEEENAVRILMNSSNSKHRLLGTTLAGFLSQTRSTRASDSSFFDEHWRSLINRVDDPYIRAVLSRVGGDGWESVLEEEAIPILDRTAIAVCNLSDDELTSFLRNRLNRFMRNPSPWLSSLSFVGFTAPAVGLLQRWLERTGDIQTVALLSAHFPASRLSASERETVRRWNESYRDLLDGWGMWGQRVEYDIGRMEVGRSLGERRTAEGEQGRGVCPVCNNVLSTVHEEHLQLKSGLARERSLPNERTGACTLCGQILPRCVICLRHVEARFSSAHAHDRDEMDPIPPHAAPSDTIEQAYICCLTCRHGGHANHILPWFQGGLDGEGAHDVCPVAGCPCECANI